jgi:hypothetical protein
MKMPIVDEINLAASSTQVAGIAAQDGDWSRTQQALLDAQDRIARILREVELQSASDGSALVDPTLPTEPALPIKRD